MAWIEERRGKRASYRVVWEPPRSSGLGRQTLTFPDARIAARAKREADKRRNDVSEADVYELTTGRPYPKAEPEECPTFAEWAEQYVETNPKIELGQRNTYRGQLRREINPILGDMRLTEIDDTDILKVINHLQEKGFRRSTITNYFSLISAVLNKAVRTKKIPITVNPAIYVGWERNQLDEREVESDEDKWLEVWEFELLLGHAALDARPIILFMAETGTRIGEASALQVKDFNATNRTVKIQKTWKSDQLTGKTHLGPPKGRKKTAVRTLVLSQTLTGVLKKLTAGRSPDDFIFTSPRGKKFSPRNFDRDRWQPALALASRCVEHGDDPCECEYRLRKRATPHRLRHSYTTWMRDAGRDKRLVRRDLGHATDAMVDRVYDHGSRIADVERADLIDFILGRDPELESGHPNE